MKILSILFLSICALSSLYFGIGGSLKTENYNEVGKNHNFNDTTQVTDTDNVVYKNYAEMLLHHEDSQALNIFPWIIYLPDFVATIITACFFGMLGGVILVIKKIAIYNEAIESINFVSLPILGFFTGLVVLGINYIIPTILVSGDTKIRPITLLFLCLFAGMFSNDFYSFLAKAIHKKVFKNENN